MKRARPGRVRAALDRWLFRLGAPETGPITLHQRRIYVLPTAAGVAFAGALFAMLIASINYNLSLGYGFTFLLAGMAVASIVQAFRNLLGLSLSPSRNDAVFAGETAHLHFTITNNRPQRRPGLRLRRGMESVDFDLPPGTMRTISLPAPSERRGWLTADRIVLETRYPLGLIRAWSVLVPDARCLVHPAPERPAPPLPIQGGHTGDHPQAQGGEDDFAGLRPHRPADSPRHIAWKTVARGGPMLTKEFGGQGGGALHLDWHRLPATLDTEARLSRLTAWILTADTAGDAFALTLPDGATGMDSGPQHRAHCLRRLALFEAEAEFRHDRLG